MKRILLCIATLFFFGCDWPFHKTEWSIAFTGDILLDRGIRQQIRIHGISEIFSGIQPILQKSNFAVGNLENPLTIRNNPQKKKYVFRADPENARDLRKAGFTHLNVANNHSFDQGESGFKETVNNLQFNNIAPIGIREKTKGFCPGQITSSGDTCLIFASNLVNPEPEEFFPDSIGPERCSTNLSKVLHEYRKTHPGYILAVLLHWGREHDAHIPIEQTSFAHLLIDSGADIIIGHHPHILQKVEIYKNKPFFFSLGNLVFDQEQPSATKSMILQIRIKGGKIKNIGIYPIEIVHGIPAWAHTLGKSEKVYRDLWRAAGSVYLRN
jgi:poly-gamma-glutamate capsule biosynthesis protein CapA/YwtB (metallophosphatase superfamily)